MNIPYTKNSCRMCIIFRIPTKLIRAENTFDSVLIKPSFAGSNVERKGFACFHVRKRWKTIEKSGLSNVFLYFSST
jgi:hypothetical protein